MSTAQVSALLGSPDSRSFRDNYEAWQYADVVGFGQCEYITIFIASGVVRSMTSRRGSSVAGCGLGSAPVDWSQMRGSPQSSGGIAKQKPAEPPQSTAVSGSCFFVSQDGLTETVSDLLKEIQQNLLDRATRFRDDNTRDVDNFDDFKEAVKTGFARVWWAGDNEEEQRVKEDTKATIRCFPFDQPGGSGTCFYTGKPADKIAIFGRAY